jgi:outer membrane autotransporter protein/uncharacterized repeat protein (TIGR01451 family)
VTIEDPVLTPITPAGGTGTTPQNTSIVLKLKYAGATLPVAGENIAWDVTGEPSVAAGTITGETSGPPSHLTTFTDPNGFTQITFNVTVPGTYTVFACHESDGCLSGDDTATFTITVPVLTADLQLSKTATPNPVPAGGQLTYKMTIHNAGPDPTTAIVLNDTLAPELGFVSIDTPGGWTCSTPAVGASGNITCNKRVMTATADNTITVLANVSPTAVVGSTITNTATITSSADPDNSNDSATATVTVAAPVVTNPSMTLAKVLSGSVDNDSSGSISVGDQLNYTVTANNNGDVPLTNVHITDDHFAGTMTCATLAVNADCVLTGSYVVTGADLTAGSVVNTGTATATEITGSKTASVTTNLAPSMTVTKLLTGTADNDSSGTVSIGDRLDYSVTAHNDGDGPLHNVVVSDNHFAATQSCPTLAVNADCVLTGSYVVTSGDLTAGSVTNVGSATSTEVPSPPSSSVITPIVAFEPVTLGIGTGDGQSAPVNTPFPQALTVVAGGTPLVDVGGPSLKSNLVVQVAPGVTINWQVMSGSANMQFPSSITNGSGVASNNAFAGPNPGPVVVRASRADQPSTYVDFHLTVTAVDEPSFTDLPGLDANQRALAEALDEICAGSPTGGGTDLVGPSASSITNYADLLARCNELLAAIDTDPTGVIEALNQLFGDIALVQSESSLLAAQSQFDNIKARIAALRSGTNRTSFGGLAFRNASGSLPIGSMFQGLMDQEQTTPEGGTPKEVGTDFSRWGFFASGTIGKGDANAGTLSPEYDFDIDGLTVGADYRKSDKLIFGGTLGYTKQTNDLAGNRGNLDTKGWSVSAYGTWYQQSSWYVDGVLSWGQNSYDIERHVRYVILTPSGETTIDNSGHGSGDGDTFTAALSVGRDFNKGAWGFGPYLRAMYTKMDFDTIEEQFNETIPGNGLALELDTRSVTSLTSTLGGKLTYAHSTSWGVLIPHFQFEWQHEFEDDPAKVEMRFLADPLGTPFSIEGDPIDTDFFRFGVGMSFVMTKGRSGFFYYERLISRERFSQNSLALGIRLEF